MSERDALLRAIGAEPDDDAVRLVFADWLDDHGEPDRAAFIRGQCAAAALPNWDVERRLLLWQAAGLLERHPEWRAGLPELDGLTWGRFERGFIAEVVVADWAALVRHADAIGQAGTVSAVVVLRADRAVLLEGLPRLSWLRRLVLDSDREHAPRSGLGRRLYGQGVSRLAQAPLLGTLRELNLDNHSTSDEGVRALAHSPHLRGLTALSLNQAEAKPGVWQELLASSNTRHLRRLSIRGPNDGLTGFRVEVVRALAEAVNLAGLESLDISNRHADAACYLTLLTSPHLAGLRELIARVTFPDVGALQSIASPKVRVRLKALDFTHNHHFRRGELRHLLAIPCLAELERLSLADNRLTGPDGEMLATASWRTTLTYLDLSHNRLQGAGLRRMFAADWPRLRVLRLAETGLKGAAALSALCGWSGLERLAALDLTGHELGEDAEMRLRDAGLPADARLALGPVAGKRGSLSERDDW